MGLNLKEKQNHKYSVSLTWTGNKGLGTQRYDAYDRDFTLKADKKPDLIGSSDPAFRGDPTRWNPEDLLVSSLSACHQLWYLHLCAVNQINVIAYFDEAIGTMVEHSSGSGEFTLVTLQPTIEISKDSDVDLAKNLHQTAHELCFIARSVNFEVACNPTIIVSDNF